MITTQAMVKAELGDDVLGDDPTERECVVYWYSI